MTAELEKRREETLARRREKVENFYKDKAEEILKKAEEFFVVHPRNREYKAVIRMPRVVIQSSFVVFQAENLNIKNNL